MSYKELPFNESPVDLYLLATDKHAQYSFAAVGVDDSLRLYSLPNFKTLSEAALHAKRGGGAALRRPVAPSPRAFVVSSPAADTQVT